MACVLHLVCLSKSKDKSASNRFQKIIKMSHPVYTGVLCS
uniref:Uncharacterized protein n=1 Tax=Anguilla anguilla TaxID=7936 RepID=A0A0E9SGG4_ANGAN